MNILEVLARIPLFQKLEQGQLEKIAAISRTLPADPNTVIIQQGAEGNAFYCILKGCVDVISHRPDKPDESIALLGPGEYFGEMSLLTGHQCSATIKTREPCEFASIPRKDFNDLLLSNFELYKYFTAVLCVRLEHMARKLEDLVHQRTLELAQTNKSLTEIMRSINQSILTINPDGTINPEFSSRTRDIYGPQLVAGASFVDLVSDSDGKKAYWQKWIHLAFTNRFLDWNNVVALMPVKKLAYQAAPADPVKQIRLSVLPIDVEENGQSIRQKLMIISTDITREEELEKKISHDSRKNQMAITLLRSRNMFDDYCAETQLRFRAAAALFQKPGLARKDVEELFRIIHTIKGSGASLNLFPLTELCHQLETDLARIPAVDGVFPKAQFQDGMRKLEATLAETKAYFEQIAGRSDTECKRIEPWEIRFIKTLLRRKRFREAADILDGLKKPSLYGYLAPKAQAVLHQTLDHTGKKARLDCRIQRARVPWTLIRNLEIIIPHLLRNAVDHGLELPEVRTRRGKAAEGRIRVKAQIRPTGFHLEIADDGQGIDPRKLVKTAIRKEILTAKTARKMSEAEKLNLIFLQGFSTKEAADEISGRGVGMDAVKRSIERARGTIQIQSRLRKGTTFKVFMPL